MQTQIIRVEGEHADHLTTTTTTTDVPFKNMSLVECEPTTSLL